MNDLFGDLTTEENFYPSISKEDSYGRTVYLIEHLGIKLPAWVKSKFPFGNDLDKPKSLWSPLLQTSYKTGKSFGEGDLNEFRQCIDKVLIAELKEYNERAKFWEWLGSLSEGIFNENLEIPMKDIVATEGIERFTTGFYPFDKCMPEGLYQAIVTVAANPGSGKTTMLLAAMKELAQQFEVWYFQTEIPAQMIQATLYKLQPSKWDNEGRLFCGNYSTKSILDKLKKNPNPNRIIIYDSPEIKHTALDDLIYWEQVYQDLVAIKMQSKAVFVTSQIKQNIQWSDLNIYSLSGSASKARFSDIILYVNRYHDNAQFETKKNRFGSLGNSMVKFDYRDIKIVEDEMTELFG